MKLKVKMLLALLCQMISGVSLIDNDNVTKIQDDGNQDEVQRTLKMLESAEVQIKQTLKSFARQGLPYVMRMVEEVNISSSCIKTGSIFMRDLIQLKLWTIKIVDSIGKPSAGITEITTWIQGDFDQCLSIRTTEKIGQYDKKKDVVGRYCALMMELPEVDPEIVEAIAGYKNSSLLRLVEKLLKPLDFKKFLEGMIRSKSGMRFDLCIPSTCSEEDLENIGRWILGDMGNIRIEFCKTKDQKTEYSTAQLICLTVFCFFVVWVILAGVVDTSFKMNIISVKKFKGVLVEYILMASPYKSAGKLLSINYNEETKAFCGIKFFLICIIIFGHECVFILEIKTIGEKYENMFHLMDNIFYEIFLQSFSMIETFFLISGFLMMYLQKGSEINSLTTHVLSLIKRTVRLTFPLCCALACGIILPLLGDGPHWHNVVRQGKFLEETWWRYLLHFHNIVVMDQKVYLYLIYHI